MEENKEAIQAETKKKKSSIFKWTIIIEVFIALCVGIWYFGNKVPNIVVIEPEKPAVTKEAFNELPVGVIYEFSAEEQKQFKELAMAKYNHYGDMKPNQSDSWESDEGFYRIRRDISRRSNSSPEEMLNDDFSLRYPDAFYGYVVSKKENATRFKYDDITTIKDVDINERVNQILNLEQYYVYQNNGIGGVYSIDGHVYSLHYGTDWDGFLSDVLLNNGGEYPDIVVPGLLKKAYDSGLLHAENFNTNKIFELMYAPQMFPDPYEIADKFRVGEHTIVKMVDGMENVPSKYDIIDQIPDVNVSYYYPTKIWKVDNNTIVVDIRIDDGDVLSPDDVAEINAKIAQSNTVGDIGRFKNIVEVNSESYIVYTRLFNADLTQGVMPDFGVGIANYATTGGWGLQYYNNYCDGYVYAYDDTAKEVLRKYYSRVKTLMESGEAILSSEILSNVANQLDISYYDALNIWATYYISHAYDSYSYDLLNYSEY